MQFPSPFFRKLRGKYRALSINLRTFRAGSIFIRNVLVIACLLMVLLGCVALYTGRYIERGIASELENLNLFSLEKSVDAMNLAVETSVDYAVMLSNSAVLQKAFFYAERPDMLREQVELLYEQIHVNKLIFEYVHSVYVYIERVGWVIDGKNVLPVEELEDDGWLSLYEAIDSNRYVEGLRVCEATSRNLISILCPLYTGARKDGAVIVNLDIRQLGRLMSRKMMTKQFVFITDGEKKLYYSTNYRMFYRSGGMDACLADALNQPAGATLVRSFEGEQFLVSTLSSSRYDLRFLIATSYSSYQTDQAASWRGFFVMILLLLILTVLIALCIGAKTYRPIQEILDTVDYVAAREPKDNEISHIIGQIQDGRRESHLREQTIRRQKTQLREAYMVALQAQINPHFLYNTLDTMKWMAVKQAGGENPLSDMIGKLGRLIRISLEKKHMVVRLSEEIAHVTLYMQLLNARYANGIRFEVDVPAALLERNTLKLSLQPLVENAVKHGLRPLHNRGTVRVGAALADDRLSLCVEDDGVGMSMDAAGRLNEELSGGEALAEEEHIGLKNVNQRIRLLCGEGYGVSVSPGEKGLRVVMTLPAELREEEP